MSLPNKSKQPAPSFFGRAMPSNIVFNNEEDDGRTRRAARVLPVHVVKPTISLQNPKPTPSLLRETPLKKQLVPIRKAPLSHSWRSKMNYEDVPELPPMYTLERTAVFVPNAPVVGRVLERIDAVLRERSIEAHFDLNKATCTTMEGVEFDVQLFRGRGSKFSHGIIVEVQRLDRVSLCFHQDTTAILRAALNRKPQRETRIDRLPSVSDSEDDMEASRGNSIEMISKMFQHPGTQRLALEALVTVTNPKKMGSKTAKEVSCQVLQAGNSVGAKMISLILREAMDNDLRTMAMEALGNALRLTSRYTLPTDRLRLVLKQDLQLCDTNPRAAYMAARCLEHIMDANDPELHDALENSCSFGQARYIALARQSRRCLECC